MGQAQNYEIHRLKDALAAANQRISMLEAAWLESEGITADQTRLEPSVEGVLRLLDERDAALAHAAEMRKALEPFAQMTIPRSINATPRLTGADALLALWLWLRDINHVHHSCGIVYASAIYDCVASLRAVLALTPGEALERIKREAITDYLDHLANEDDDFVDRLKGPRSAAQALRDRAAELRKEGE